jgi:hypothetical protein
MVRTVMKDKVAVRLHVSSHGAQPGCICRPDRSQRRGVPIYNEVPVVLQGGEIATFVRVQNFAGNKSLSWLQYASGCAACVRQRQH